MDRLNRILGGLFGVACGDALGGTLEFVDGDEGRETYGYHKDIIGGGLMDLKPGEVTDDTIMTMCVAKGILENPEDPMDNIGEHFIAWHMTFPKDEGLTIRTALDMYLRHKNWETAAKKTQEYCRGRGAGNGTLMRCIPAALYYREYNKMVEITKKQSDMTHLNEKCAEACTLYNTMVYRYLKGEGKVDVLKDVLRGTEYETVFEIKREDLHPSGYVVDTMLCALWSFINHDDLENIICEAVNLYGDPDTIGAIAGGIAGVYYGYEAIPDRWKSVILVKDELLGIAGEFDRV